MKRFDKDFKYFIGQGENSDLFVSVIEFDRKFDHYFEMDYSKAESNLITIDDDLYPGLDDSALLTSYLDYFQIHEDLPLNETLVDLGAGYCRGSLLFDALGKNRCISIEVAANRVVGAQKVVPEDIIIADMISPGFDIPDSNFYFIYLPVSKVLYALFKKIIAQEIEATFYVIESHGDLIDFFRIHDSLFTLIGKPFKTSTPRHKSWVHKFKSNRVKKYHIDDENFHSNISLWHLYNYDSNKKFVIESQIMNSKETKIWEAAVKGSSLINYNGELAVYLENPSRILQLKTQDKIIGITL